MRIFARKKIKKKAPLFAALTLFLLSFLLSGCTFRVGLPERENASGNGNENVSEDETGSLSAPDTTVETTAQPEKPDGADASREDYFAALPSVDYGGREFLIVTTDEQFVESESESGIIGKYLYRRNRAIEEKFNIKIKVLSAGDAEIQLGLQAQSADAPYADLLYAPMEANATYAGRGLLMNLYSVPFFRYDAPYAEPEAQRDLTVSDTAYSIYGDAAFDQRAAWCVFYNKSLLSSLGYDPALLVKDGGFTWDMLLLTAEGAVSDLDGNRRMSGSVDRFGYSAAMNTTSLCKAAFASFGKHYFTRDEDGLYAMDYDISDTDDYVSILRRLCVGESALYPSRNPGNDALAAFNEGRLAYFMGPLTYAATLAYSEVDWGILPMPVRFAGEAYKSLVDPSAACGYSVPYGVRDSDLCGRVLSAIYAYEASYGEQTVKNAWTYYYLRDNTSAAMLSAILENRVYDIAYTFGAGFPDFSIASYELLSSVMENDVNFSYLYAQNLSPFSAFMLKQFTN